MDTPVVNSVQSGPHSALEVLVRKHLRTEYRKPVNQHTQQAFIQATQWVAEAGKPLLLDAGCGTGESTLELAKQYPDYFTLGIDKSLHRLSKNTDYSQPPQKHNSRLLRADLIDFWRLALGAGWKIEKHFLLYPNPWPKPHHLGRRWHGHPVFPTLLKLSPVLHLRTNWKIYAEEFAQACYIATGEQTIVREITPSIPLTPFEKKYIQSGHLLYEVTVCNT